MPVQTCVLKVRSQRVIRLRKICHVSRFYMACWEYVVSTCEKGFNPRPWQFLLCNFNKKCNQKSVFYLFEVPGNFSDSSKSTMHMDSLFYTKTEREGKKKSQLHSKEKLEVCLLQYTSSLQKAQWKSPPSRGSLHTGNAGTLRCKSYFCPHLNHRSSCYCILMHLKDVSGSVHS